MLKTSNKDNILKVVKEKNMLQRNVVLIGNKGNKKIFKVLEGKNCQLKILYPIKLFVKNESEINIFITSRYTL